MVKLQLIYQIKLFLIIISCDIHITIIVIIISQYLIMNNICLLITFCLYDTKFNFYIIFIKYQY